VWSPDSRQITLALSTATDLDIFSVSPDGSNFRNFSQNPAHDFWPVWSPDGQFMAFVSDRAVCKTWEPNAPDTCYSEDAPPPDGGHLYLYAAANGEVRKLSDDWLTAPPRWITPMRVGYSAGTRGDPIAETALKWVNALTGTVTTISPEGTSALNEAWTVDGSKVIYQEIGTDADIVVRDDNGNELGRLADLDFPRFGFAAAWSPDGLRLVVGGRNGQCPYGMTLFNDALESLFRAQPRPGVCDPEFSPDGRYVAFGGVQPGADGAFDLYLSSPSGGGIRSVTGRFGGQIRPLGWVGRAR
jgi:Tol biopolymer transport system component